MYRRRAKHSHLFNLPRGLRALLSVPLQHERHLYLDSHTKYITPSLQFILNSINLTGRRPSVYLRVRHFWCRRKAERYRSLHGVKCTPCKRSKRKPLFRGIPCPFVRIFNCCMCILGRYADRFLAYAVLLSILSPLRSATPISPLMGVSPNCPNLIPRC